MMLTDTDTLVVTYKGERMYASWLVPAKLLELGFEPVWHDQADADAIAAFANQDDTLTHVQLEAKETPA